MSFAMKKARGVFQELINTMLAGLMMVPYLDDIVICGRTEEEHYGLYKVLKCIQEYFHVKLEKRKCSLP